MRPRTYSNARVVLRLLTTGTRSVTSSRVPDVRSATESMFRLGPQVAPLTPRIDRDVSANTGGQRASLVSRPMSRVPGR